jgi:LPS-assembly protein
MLKKGVCSIISYGVLCGVFSAASAVGVATDPTQSYDIEADYVFHDKQKDLIYANGHVVVNHADQMMLADYAIYTPANQSLYASGNVAIRRFDGSMFFGDVVRLDKQWDRGTISNFRARLSAHSNIAAKAAEVMNDNQIALHHMVYSACKLCDDNFIPGVPLWQVRSESSVLSKNEEVIRHKNAKLEAFGVPVFYAPYFWTPAPGAKRKSGFLFPIMSFSSIQGASVYVPFYWNIAPNMDATIGAKMHNVGGRYDIIDMHVRYLGRRSYHDVKHSLNYGYKENKTTFNKEGRHLNAHAEVESIYHTPSIAGASGMATLSSKAIFGGDKNYLRRNHISEDLVLNTDAHVRYFDHHQYYSVRGLYFQDLRPDSHNNTTAMLLPGFSYINDNVAPSFKAFKPALQLHYSNVMRMQGMGYQRVVGIASANHRFISQNGLVLDSKASVRGDFYHTTFKPVTVASNYQWNTDSRIGAFARHHPQINMMLHRPMLRRIGDLGITLDPMLQAIASPHQKRSLQLENEDSHAPVLNGYNLFSENRYDGFDMIESGGRLNYGVVLDLASQQFKSMRLIAGQSYKRKRESFLDKFSGLDARFSDYVAEMIFKPKNNWAIGQSMRFDHRTAQVNLNEFSISYSANKMRFSMLYWAIAKGLLQSDPSSSQRSKQEVVFSPGYNFYREWWLDLQVHSRLGKKPNKVQNNLITNSLSLKNNNECLQTEFTIKRDYTKITHNKPETTYLIRISVPTF